MLVLDDRRPPCSAALGPAFGAWRKAVAEPPLLISRAEWARAADAFPIEITDMRAAYQVLRGADPLARRRGGARPTCGRRWSASSGASCSGFGRGMCRCW